MKTRTMGQGLTVSALGLGCMGMSQSYGAIDDEQASATLCRAVELGVTLFDSADVYGDGHNEELLGRVLAPHREEVVYATKFGNIRGVPVANGKPEYVRSACEASLRRLNVDYIDLYYQHRIDPTIPIEDTWGALSELVTSGKVRFLGISEAGISTLRRAHAVHPIAVAQYEYSLFTRDPESELLPVLAELGIGFAAYCPIGRGILSGTLAEGDFSAGDSRPHHPRFQEQHFSHNQALVATLRDIASGVGATATQLALAWLLTRGDNVVPIPGTKRVKYLEENIRAAALELSPTTIQAIEAAIPPGSVSGARYEAAQLARINL